MLEFIKKHGVLIGIAIGLLNLLTGICIAIYVFSFNRENFKLTHQDHGQDHGQILQKIDNIEDKLSDKEFLRLLENEKSILYERLDKCNESYDILLDDYFEVL